MNIVELFDQSIALFSEPFMLRALYGGVLIAIMTAIIGVFATLKKESFIADGIAHASLAGVAIGLILTGQPLLFALIVGILMSLVLTYIKLQTRLSADSAIGIAYPFFFALGILLLYTRDRFSPELETFIFGNVVSITNADLVYTIAAFIFVIVMMYAYYKDLLAVTFDREAAQLNGINVNVIEYLYAVMTAVVVIVSTKLIGIVLVTALLVIPAAHARIHARKFANMIPLAICHNTVSLLFGLVLSLKFPPGAVIIVVSTVILLGGYTVRLISNRKSS